MNKPERQQLRKQITGPLRASILQNVKEIQKIFNSKFELVLNRLDHATEPSEIVDICEDWCAVTRDLTSKAHQLKMSIDWGVPDSPEWMNHFQDWFFQSLDRGATFWIERGIFARLSFGSKKPDVLELCCGDGFNTKNFYSPYANSILALDFDIEAHKHAVKFNGGENIQYRLADIRSEIPNIDVDNVIWDAAIEHFDDNETTSIITSIKNCLERRHGTLAGYTLVERSDGKKSLHQHEREFRSKEDLHEMLSKFFPKVVVFETFAPQRHNLYFFATVNGELPFIETWNQMVSSEVR